MMNSHDPKVKRLRKGQSSDQTNGISWQSRYLCCSSPFESNDKRIDILARFVRDCRENDCGRQRELRLLLNKYKAIQMDLIVDNERKKRTIRGQQRSEELVK
jgi:hypothetical protein